MWQRDVRHRTHNTTSRRSGNVLVGLDLAQDFFCGSCCQQILRLLSLRIHFPLLSIFLDFCHSDPCVVFFVSLPFISSKRKAQGVLPLCAARPSCRRSLGVYRCIFGRNTEVRLADSVGQLRWLNRQACVFCGIIRSQQCRRCNFCWSDTPLRELRVGTGKTAAQASGRSGRRHGSRSATPSGRAASTKRTSGRQPASELPHLGRRSDSELRRASAMALPRCVVSRGATAWAESLGGWALLCRYSCRFLLAEVTQGVDRKSELKQRLHLATQRSDLQSPGSGPPRRTTRGAQPQTDEQPGKRARALTAQGSTSKATKGLCGGAAQGSADCRRNSSCGARALELSPPVWSVPSQLESPGVEGDTNSRGAP